MKYIYLTHDISSAYLATFWWTYSTELSPFWEATSCAAAQEFYNILWNPEVHYRVHKSPPLVPILSQAVQSIPHHPVSLTSILILSTHLRLVLPSGVPPSVFPTISYMHSSFLIRAKGPANVILLHLSILNIHGEEYKLWSSLLCSFYQPPGTSFLFFI
jgi:hypothetical protein